MTVLADESRTLPESGTRNRPAPGASTALASSDVLARAFVHAVFAAMVAALAWYVWMYGRNLPFWDDWESVPVLSGSQPFSLAWLWKQQNEHRFPVARLVTFLIWRGAGDLRLVMVLTNLVLSAVTFGLIQAARWKRGRMSITDAFFPLVLLNWGMYENLIFAIQLFFVSAPALALAILLVALSEWHGRLARVVGMGVCLNLLPLNGAIGLMLLPCLLALLAVLGVSRLCSTEPSGRRDGIVLLSSCVIAALLAAGYLIAFEANPLHPGARSVADFARTAAEVLSMSIGPAGHTLWPAAAVGAIGVITVAVLVAGVGGVLATSRTRTGARRALHDCCVHDAGCRGRLRALWPGSRPGVLRPVRHPLGAAALLQLLVDVAVRQERPGTHSCVPCCC